jgi:hypothetical protein
VCERERERERQTERERERERDRERDIWGIGREPRVDSQIFVSGIPRLKYLKLPLNHCCAA